MTHQKILSVSLDYGMTALVAIISGQLQVPIQLLKTTSAIKSDRLGTLQHVKLVVDEYNELRSVAFTILWQFRATGVDGPTQLICSWIFLDALASLAFKLSLLSVSE